MDISAGAPGPQHVVGYVAATLLNLPRIKPCAGNDVTSERFLAVLRKTCGLTVAPACFCAAASSQHLLISAEPPEFLDSEERRAFAPLAFRGSLSDPAEKPDRKRGAPDRRRQSCRHRRCAAPRRRTLRNGVAGEHFDARGLVHAVNHGRGIDSSSCITLSPTRGSLSRQTGRFRQAARCEMARNSS